MRLSWSLSLLLAVVLLQCGCAEVLSQVEGLTGQPDSEPADGVREALRVGSERAVDALGRADGFLGRPEVRIPVPQKMEDAAKALRLIGADDMVEEFTTSLNRAAEAAVPLAKPVFTDAIRQMTVEDALGIVRGRGHEATDYFRDRTSDRLAQAFRPIVAEKLDEVGATRSFERLMERITRLPLVERPPVDLDAYVTDEALDGLFQTLAHEEERIREDPLARTTALLRRWFE